MDNQAQKISSYEQDKLLQQQQEWKKQGFQRPYMNSPSPEQQQDPFAIQEGQGQYLPPNIPMPDPSQHQLIKELLSDDSYPEPLKQEFPWVFNRDVTLSFQDQQRQQSKMIDFMILRIDSMGITPYYDYTFEDEFKWSMVRNIFETKLDRARGLPKKDMVNERVAQVSQFQEAREIRQDESFGNQREGFLRRLLGRR